MKWRRVKLIDAAEINPGIPRDLVPEPSELVTFLPMAAVGEDGAVNTSETRSYGAVSKGYTVFCMGDVLLAKITPCMENGKAALVNGASTRVGCGSTEFHVLRARAGVDPRYLFHLIWNEPFRRLAARNMTGSAGQKRVPKSFLETHSIPLPHKNGKPDLDEQKRIAAILDKADAIRRKRQQALRLTDDFLRSVFLDMFGDPVTNLKGWEEVYLEELLSAPPRIGTTTPAKSDGLHRVVRVGELGEKNVALDRCGKVTLTESDVERFTTVAGDILLARAIGSKGHLGKASLFQGSDETVVFDSHVMRLRANPSILLPKFFYHWLTSEGGKTLLVKQGGQTAVQFNINARQINALRIPLPPLKLQQKFEIFLDGLSPLIARAISSGQESEHMFVALQQRAFRGDL